MSTHLRDSITVLCLTLAIPAAHAQRAGNDWTTVGFDAHRSHWLRNDPKISVANLRKPGFELVWKLKLAGAPRQLQSLTPPALLDFYISHRGFRTLGFFGTASNRVVGVDTDLGRIEWEKQVAPAPPASGATAACPGGMTAPVTRPASLAYPPVPTGRSGGRGAAPKSSVGEPFKGAVTIRPFPTPQPAPPAQPSAAAKPAGPRVFSPFEPHLEPVYSIASDGKLHTHYVSNGEEPHAPIAFLPPNANAIGLIATNEIAYVATVNNCGGVDNGIWALDLKSQKVTRWKTSNNIAGTAGLALGPDGTIYAAAGPELVALSSRDLEPKAVYKSDAGEFASTPAIFDYQGRNLLAVRTRQGRIQIFDTASLKTPLASADAPAGDSGALATWQDPAGTRWLHAAAGNVIQSWKLSGKDAALTLDKAWASRELVAPLPPIVVNGVVFAVSSGQQRTGRPVPAVLYAMDAQTGAELWNSGKTITSFVHTGGLAAGGTRVYVGAHDGTQYAFGFPIEH